MYLRRLRVAGHSFAAALAHLSTVVMLPAHAAQKLSMVLVVRRRYLIVVPRPFPAAPRKINRTPTNACFEGTSINTFVSREVQAHIKREKKLFDGGAAEFLFCQVDLI
jgi:hypothetical protein